MPLASFPGSASKMSYHSSWRLFARSANVSGGSLPIRSSCSVSLSSTSTCTCCLMLKTRKSPKPSSPQVGLTFFLTVLVRKSLSPRRITAKGSEEPPRMLQSFAVRPCASIAPISARISGLGCFRDVGSSTLLLAFISSLPWKSFTTGDRIIIRFGSTICCWNAFSTPLRTKPCRIWAMPSPMLRKVPCSSKSSSGGETM
mmetsp:Transcript_50654/g.144824  ORF Transcript_50654/g.144824 Transcript_50654/m.144824 type:complete len:200 (+) Transcript_50654:1257-1856(+)